MCHGEDFLIKAHGEEIKAKKGRDSERERRGEREFERERK